MLTGKTDFLFGRMYVDIHLIAGNRYKQDCQRKLPFHQAPAVSFHQGMLNHSVTNRSSIYKDENSLRRGARDPGKRHPTFNQNAIGFVFFVDIGLNGEKASAKILAENVDDPACRVPRRRPVLNNRAVMGQLEVNFRPPQSNI